MLNSKTVFVVGAGASREVNLPAGGQLRRIISDKLDIRLERFERRDSNYGDHKIYNWIRMRPGNTANTYLEACRRIRDGILLSASIDDFLDVHREDREMEQCGKLAIARAILEAEKSSPLSYDTGNIYNTLDFSPLDNTWYMGFFRLLHEGLSKANRHDIFKNASVITFNYDRCIEHFLVHALAAHYHIKRDEARELAQQLPIFRPYGSVGNYLEGQSEHVPFGYLEFSDWDHVTKNIRTYTEQVKDDESLNRIRKAVQDARVVVFLGNAFHSNNMTLITPDEATTTRKNVYFTRSGVSDADLQVVKHLLMRLSGNTPKYVPHPDADYHYTDTCYKLFEEFRMSLRQ